MTTKTNRDAASTTETSLLRAIEYRNEEEREHEYPESPYRASRPFQQLQSAVCSHSQNESCSLGALDELLQNDTILQERTYIRFL